MEMVGSVLTPDFLYNLSCSSSSCSNALWYQDSVDSPCGMSGTRRDSKKRASEPLCGCDEALKLSTSMYDFWPTSYNNIANIREAKHLKMEANLCSLISKMQQSQESL